MPLLDLLDQTFVVAPVAELRAVLCDELAWARLDIPVTPREDRGLLGVRWDVGGPLRGTAEVWLEQAHRGVVVHVFLQADPVRRSSSAAAHRRWAAPLKRWVLDVKRGHDVARPAAVVPPDPGEGTTTMSPVNRDPEEA
ncbi:hypothetical protein ACHAAC_04660 [Aeromicrobium sp. CF4.19]|uniref:hypothetical protein n=1 Tax=Aeromicrobium sp. CF4.19 TaxID=3373082 RepID=UPI003EE7C0D3